MSLGLTGWHPGERAIRSRVGLSDTRTISYTAIAPYMPEQHRIFYTRTVPFLPLTTRDAKGRPWASIVSGGPIDGKGPGFVKSPSETELIMRLDLWEGDPILDNLDLFNETGRMEERISIAGLGIEFPTRRRNKFAGWVERVEKLDLNPNSRLVYMRVNQAIGNCPKYINVRELEPYPHTSPHIIYRSLDMSPDERLPAELIEFILRADTVFLGTSYSASTEDRLRYPSHVGMNARGGLPGFIRVRPSDGRTLILPDYSGNQILTSLGNVEASSRAAMTFLDFEKGDVLYLTGTAENLVGKDAQEIMPRQNVLTAMHVEGFIFIRDAMSMRQRPGTEVERSPYSPPIKFLAEERKGLSTTLDEVFVTLTRIKILTATLATFTFETSKPVRILPGQTAALDFTDLLGSPQYAHMAPGREASLNDDRIRTWTVSSWSPESETNTFSLTMREKPGGLVTGSLFALARHAQKKMPEVLEDTRRVGLRVRLVGIAGAFVLPPLPESGKSKMLWVAGGIGVTPYLSMLRALSSFPPQAECDVVLLLSTREPEVLLGLIRDALPLKSPLKLKLLVHVFSVDSSLDNIDLSNTGVMDIVMHQKRLEFSKTEDTLSLLAPDAKERSAYLCGPPLFEEVVMDALARAGVERSGVVREGFGY